MNVKLLRKVAEYILAEPKRFFMPDFVRWKESRLDRLRNKHDGKIIDRPFPRCGTAACIGGWVCILSDKKETADSEVAAELLQINKDQAERLFFNAPSKFWDIWSGDGTKKTAKLAAARIEHFIRTDGKE